MRAESVIAAAAVGVVIAACSCATGSADSTSESPPFPIGQMGVPVHAQEAGGATADITVNSATWLPPGCASHFAIDGSACNVVEVTITGTSHRFFHFDQRYIFAGYGGGNQPWTHPADAPQPSTLAVDYQRLHMMPPLQTGGLHDGQTAHGFVGFTMPRGGDLYITMNDPEQLAPYTDAGWIVHT